MNTEELKQILELHRKWRNGEVGGQRADLEGEILEGVNLSGARLLNANLTHAYLAGANLKGAILTSPLRSLGHQQRQPS